MSAASDTKLYIVRSYIEGLAEHRPSDVDEAVALTALHDLVAENQRLREALELARHHLDCLHIEDDTVDYFRVERAMQIIAEALRSGR